MELIGLFILGDVQNHIIRLYTKFRVLLVIFCVQGALQKKSLLAVLKHLFDSLYLNDMRSPIRLTIES